MELHRRTIDGHTRVFPREPDLVGNGGVLLQVADFHLGRGIEYVACQTAEATDELIADIVERGAGDAVVNPVFWYVENEVFIVFSQYCALVGIGQCGLILGIGQRAALAPGVARERLALIVGLYTEDVGRGVEVFVADGL